MVAAELRQQGFGTYYHAVALDTEETVLVTAAEHYLRTARPKGRIHSSAGMAIAPPRRNESFPSGESGLLGVCALGRTWPGATPPASAIA